MPSYTFTKAGREFRVDGPRQLSELVRDRLLAPDDEVMPDDGTTPVRVADLLGLRPAAAGSDDPWAAWDDDDDDDGTHDLVEQMLSGGVPGVRPRRGDPAGDGPPVGPPRSSRYLLGGGGARRDHLAPDAPADPAAEASSQPVVRIAPPVGGGEEPAELPASFVQYVQQKRAVASPLEIHDAADEMVLHGEGPRRHLPWLIPLLAGLGAIALAASLYGVVRTGAQRTYPTEAEVRSGAWQDRDGGAAAPTPAVAVTPETDELREIRVWESLPHAVRPFRDVVGLQDALFTDVTNSGVRVRAVRIAPLVLKPDAGGIPTRPEEVHLEIDLASEDGPALEGDLLRAALVLGHYGADAHLRLQDVLLRADVGAEDPLCYRVRGPELVALYEREVPLTGFVAGLESVLPSLTVVPPPEETDEGDPIPGLR